MAAGKLARRLEDLKSQIDRLSPRERVMIGGLGLTFVLGVVFVVGYIVFSGLEEIEENNDATLRALKDLQENRECFVAHRHRAAQMEGRISRTPVELNRMVETAASAVGVSIAESGEITPVVVDQFTHRGVEIKLRKVTIDQLAKLMKELENSPTIVQVTSLSVTTRWNQHKDLDVELIVSTYERRAVPEGGEKRRRPRDRT